MTKRKAREMTTHEGEWTEATQGAEANADEEWREVEAEEQIAIEYEGDGFIARYIEMDPPNANGIIQGHFTNVMDLEGNYLLETAFLNLTRDLVNKFKKVPEKAIVRVQWKSSLDTGHKSGTKMRVFDVRWKM